MRLLKSVEGSDRSQPATFSFTSFKRGSVPPRYAVLSHRWTADEVTFEDVVSGTAASRKGYRKLQFCAEQAARDGIDYFWIDACCINKCDSSEVSQAINSMFRWYRESAKCYVYLSDVYVQDQHGQGHVTNLRQAFRASEWFTRGWTLQELVAPREIDFFSQEGSWIGNKSILEEDLVQASGVPAVVLRGKPLDQIEASERFSWIANRVTTIDEDIVYCLLGIFNVTMLLLYGEGRDKAFRRLRKQIRKAEDSRPRIKSHAPFIVPYEQNRLFVGRDTQLASLEKQIFLHDEPLIILGPGASGKTQLALELAYRTRMKWPDCTILWVHADTQINIITSIRRIAHRLSLVDYTDERYGLSEVIELVLQYLRSMSSGQWLLIYDDVDSYHDIMPFLPGEDTVIVTEDGPEQLRDQIPHHRRTCIILTTQARNVGFHADQSLLYDLSVSHEEDAIDLLSQHLRNEEPSQYSDALRLVTELDYQPLAISMTAEYMLMSGCTMEEYTRLLSHYQNSGKFHQPFQENWSGPTSVDITTQASLLLKRIPEGSLAGDYIRFIACLHHEDIPWSLLPSGLHKWEQQQALYHLAGRCDIRRERDTSTVHIGRMMQLALQSQLRQEDILSAWQQKALARLEAIFPAAEGQNRELWRSYMPHARHVLRTSSKSRVSATSLSLLRKCALCLMEDDEWTQVEVMCSDLLASEGIQADDRGNHVRIVEQVLTNARARRKCKAIMDKKQSTVARQ